LNKEFINIAKEYKDIKALKSSQDISLEITKTFTKLVKLEDKITSGESYRKMCDLYFQSDLMTLSEKPSETHMADRIDEHMKEIEVQHLKLELVQRDKEIEELRKNYDEEKLSLKKLIDDVETKGEVLTSDLANMKKKLFQVTLNKSSIQRSPSSEETKYEHIPTHVEKKFEHSPSSKTRK
jgi:hypothetical protein